MRDGILESVIARLRNPSCTEDEIRVIDDVLSGLERGREVYGPLNTETDARNFEEQFCQEQRDAFTYQAAWRIARQHRRRERLACFKADREWARKEEGLKELVDACTVVDASASFDLVDGELLEVVPPKSEVLP